MTTLRLLLENFQRWRSVSFNFGNITFELPPLPQQVVAPFLEHIDIKFHSPSIPNPSYYAALVAAAPGLRSYVAHASNCNVPPNLPWAQLHKFHPTCPIRQPDAYTILSRAKSLQEFHFVIHRDPRGVIAPPPVRITSSIRSMSVIGHGTCPLDFLLLSRLDTPPSQSFAYHFLDACGSPRHRTSSATRHIILIPVKWLFPTIIPDDREPTNDREPAYGLSSPSIPIPHYLKNINKHRVAECLRHSYIRSVHKYCFEIPHFP